MISRPPRLQTSKRRHHLPLPCRGALGFWPTSWPGFCF